jgi:hypothetical protein
VPKLHVRTLIHTRGEAGGPGHVISRRVLGVQREVCTTGVRGDTRPTGRPRPPKGGFRRPRAGRSVERSLAVVDAQNRPVRLTDGQSRWSGGYPTIAGGVRTAAFEWWRSPVVAALFDEAPCGFQFQACHRRWGADWWLPGRGHRHTAAGPGLHPVVAEGPRKLRRGALSSEEPLVPGDRGHESQRCRYIDALGL